MAAGPRVAGPARLPVHCGLSARLRHRGTRGDRPAAAPEPGRAVLGGPAAAQARRAEHGHDAGDDSDAVVERAGWRALRLPGQGTGGTPAGPRRRRPGRRPVHHGHPDRHRGDPRRTRRLTVRDPEDQPGVRAPPGSHRAELPREAGHRDAGHAGRGAARPGRHGRGGPARPGSEGAHPGSAQPHRGRVRPAAARRHRRLGRGVPGDPRPRQPGAPLAADRGAGPALGGGRVRAAGTVDHLPRVRPPGRPLAGPARRPARRRPRRSGHRAGGRGRGTGRPALAGARRVARRPGEPAPRGGHHRPYRGPALGLRPVGSGRVRTC